MGRHEEKLRNIVEVASRLMQEHGYAGVPLKTLAKEMNLTEPALYHYFDSKEGLLFLIADQAMDLGLECVKQILATDLPPTLKLKRIMQSTAEIIINAVPIFTVYFRDKHNLSPENQAKMTAKERLWIDLAAGVYRQGVAQGQFEDIEPTVAILSMYGAIAWTYKWYKPSGPLRPAEAGERIIRMFLQGVLTEKGRAASLAGCSEKDSSQESLLVGE